jgi:hypothetical protein
VRYHDFPPLVVLHGHFVLRVLSFLLFDVPSSLVFSSDSDRDVARGDSPESPALFMSDVWRRLRFDGVFSKVELMSRAFDSLSLLDLVLGGGRVGLSSLILESEDPFLSVGVPGVLKPLLFLVSFCLSGIM